MANPTPLHLQTHKQLADIIESYHEHLNDLFTGRQAGGRLGPSRSAFIQRRLAPG